MLKNNLLSDRLNSYKNGEQIPEVKEELKIKYNNNIKNTEEEIKKIKGDLIEVIITFLYTTIVSFLYGSGILSLFNINLMWYETLGIGLIIFNTFNFIKNSLDDLLFYFLNRNNGKNN